MATLRAIVLSILTKADTLLTSEPARMIGYGAAVVVFLIVRLVGELKPGLFPAVSFNDAIAMAFVAISSLVILIESIRRFVFSPLTYIEDLADESDAAHEAAHLEEEMARWRQAIAERNAAAEVAADAAAAEAAADTVTTATIGSATSSGSSGLVN